jgi:hypothetical protein
MTGQGQREYTSADFGLAVPWNNETSLRTYRT